MQDPKETNNKYGHISSDNTGRPSGFCLRPTQHPEETNNSLEKQELVVPDAANLPTSVQQNGPTSDYDHLLDWTDKRATKWKKYMSQPAARLQMFLFRCVDDYGDCPVCLNHYGNSIENHITSRKHCEAVRKTAQKWRVHGLTQTWMGKNGEKYCFNHITGEQGHVFGDNISVLSTRGIYINLDIPEDTPEAFQVALRDGTGIRSEWTAYITPYALAFEQAFQRYMPNGYSSIPKCSVCNKTMTSLSQHIKSQDHIRNLQNRFDWHFPPTDIANGTRRDDISHPWFQQVEIPRGGLLTFNHLTGDLDIQAPEESVAEERETMPFGTKKQFNLAAWLWQKHVLRSAMELERAFEETTIGCGICREPMKNVVTHLASPAHFLELRNTTKKSTHVLASLEDSWKVQGPWIQRFSCSGYKEFHAADSSIFCSDQVIFNHITAEFRNAKNSSIN